jgi:hypothetical protein
MENYKSSRLAKIMRDCKKAQVCTVYPKSIINKVLPASDGGLLNILINYSEINKSFDFDWGRNLTPSYIRLKSTQPEAFVTEVMTNIKQKYDSLYNSEDKEVIMKEMVKLSRISQEPNFSEKLTSALCNWGYIGVSGSLQSMKMEIKAENFLQVRDLGRGTPFQRSFSDSFKNLLKIMWECFNDYLDQNHEIKFTRPSWFFLNKMSLRMFMVSLVHLETLMSFGGRNSAAVYLNTHDQIIFEMIKLLNTERGLVEVFKDKLVDEFLISNLPVSQEHIKDWVIVYCTLRLYFRRENMTKNLIDVVPRFTRDDKTEQPYVKTKATLSELGIELRSARVYHQGVLDQNFFDLFRGRKFAMRGKQRMVIDFNVLDHKSISNLPVVKFNEKLFFMYKFTDEFLDSEAFEDVDIELDSNETSINSFNEIVEDEYEGEVFQREPMKKVNSVWRGKTERTIKINATVLMDFTSAGFGRIIDRMRQAAENVVLMTVDFLTEDPSSNFLSKAMLFRVSDKTEEGKSLIMKRLMLCYVISPLRDRRIWESALPIIRIENEEILSLKEINMGEVRSELGGTVSIRKISKQSIAENSSLTDLEWKIKMDKEMKRDTVEKIKSEVDLNIEKFKEKGFDQETIEKYLKVVDEKGKGWEGLVDMLSEILKNDNKMKEIVKGLEEKLSENLESPMEKEKYHRIFQVPYYLSMGSTKTTDQQSKSLKDPELIAELNSFFPDFMNKILTNRLCISQKMKSRYVTGIKNLTRSMKLIRRNREGKAFVLNLMKLVVNDANLVPGKRSDEDEEWQDALDWIGEKIEEGEDVDEDDFDIVGEEDQSAQIIYKRMLERRSE